MTLIMTCDFGDVVLVLFPFTNQLTAKKRPAVIVSNKAYNRGKPDVVVMATTSQMRAIPESGDARISEWQAAGLLSGNGRRDGPRKRAV